MSVIMIDSLRFGVPVVNPTMSYVSSNSSTAGSDPVTFTAQSIGTADATRKIIVAVGWSSAADQTISSMTIGGVSAAQVVATDTSSGSGGAAIWIADVPTGTTGDIVIDWSGSVARCAIAVYRVVNLTSSTATDTDTATSASSGVISVSACTIPANGFAIASVSCIDGSGGTFTWSGITEDTDQNLASQSFHSTASKTATGSETPTIQATGTAGGSRSCLCAAAWGN